MKLNKKKEIRPSILDRLIDSDPHTQLASNVSSNQYVRDLRMSVKRDLENLLNTRIRMKSAPEHLQHLEQSLINYGLPDLATLNIIDLEKKCEFIKDLEKNLARYEPRFKSIRLHHVDNKDSGDRSLRFRIDAILYADPAPEIIIFDSILDPVFRTVTIEESHYGR